MKAIHRFYEPPAEVPTFTFRRESGVSVYVTAKRFPGEPGSLSITEVVEVTAIRDARGQHVDVTPEEADAIQREAERALA
jgi:hypothetical protein